MNQVISEIRGQGPPQVPHPPPQASHNPQAGHNPQAPPAEKGAREKAPGDKNAKGNSRKAATASAAPGNPPGLAATPGQPPPAEQNQPVSAEYALSVVMRRYANKFSQMTDRYMSERVNDIYDIEKRLLRALIGQKREDLAHLTRPVVVIAHDLLPSQTAALDKEHVIGFATDVGGRTSHTAIVARAMGIPAVVGLGNVTGEVSGGDTVIIDGTHGVVIVNPDTDQIRENVAAGKRQREADEALAKIAPEPAVTLDKHQVSLQANIEFPEDIDKALTQGAEGIGLYRTEFL
jgi:phosphoenolpyruvate-protein kinase (PTS system EI component)